MVCMSLHLAFARSPVPFPYPRRHLAQAPLAPTVTPLNAALEGPHARTPQRPAPSSPLLAPRSVGSGSWFLRDCNELTATTIPLAAPHLPALQGLRHLAARQGLLLRRAQVLALLQRLLWGCGRGRGSGSG